MNDKTLPILYTFRRCPYAMRARMAIHTAGIKVEHIEVSLKNKPQSLLEYSPKGTVPVLVTVRGEVIDQSRDIMLWALHQADPENWLLENNLLKQQEMMQLVDTCDIEFKPLLDRYKYFDRHPEFSQAEYCQQAEFFLQRLNDRLAQHHYLMDEKMRFVDVAIFPFIRQFANTDKLWFAESPYKNLQRWLEDCINTAIFAAIMETKKI
jgi:glutathione S-transferase